MAEPQGRVLAADADATRNADVVAATTAANTAAAGATASTDAFDDATAQAQQHAEATSAFTGASDGLPYDKGGKGYAEDAADSARDAQIYSNTPVGTPEGDRTLADGVTVVEKGAKQYAEDAAAATDAADDALAIYEGGTLSAGRGGATIAAEDSLSGFNTGTAEVPGEDSGVPDPYFAQFDPGSGTGMAWGSPSTFTVVADDGLNPYRDGGADEPGSPIGPGRTLRHNDATTRCQVGVTLAELGVSVGEQVWGRVVAYEDRQGNPANPTFKMISLDSGGGRLTTGNIQRTCAADLTPETLEYDGYTVPTGAVSVVIEVTNGTGTVGNLCMVDIRPGAAAPDPYVRPSATVPAVPSARDIVVALDPSLGTAGQRPTLVDDGEGGLTYEFQTPGGGGGSASVIAPATRPAVWFPGSDSLKGLGGLARLTGSSAVGTLGAKPIVTVSGHSFSRQAEIAYGMATALNARGMYGGGQMVQLKDNAKDAPFGGVTIAFTGAWSSGDGFGASGGIGSVVNTGPAGATATVDSTGAESGFVGMSVVRVFYNRASGGGSIEVYSSPDAVTYTLQATVDTSGATATNQYQDVAMPSGTEAFRLTVTGASVDIPTGVAYFGARGHGIEIWRGGNGGAQVIGTTGSPGNPTQLGTRTAANWSEILGAINPVASFVAMGYNSIKVGQENNSEAGAVIVAGAVAEQAGHIAAAGVPCLILAETASEPGYVGSSVSTAIQEAYAAELWSEVQTRAEAGAPVGLLDSEGLVSGDRTAAQAAPNFWDDGVHPSTEGGLDIGAVATGALFG